MGLWGIVSIQINIQTVVMNYKYLYLRVQTFTWEWSEPVSLKKVTANICSQWKTQVFRAGVIVQWDKLPLGDTCVSQGITWFRSLLLCFSPSILANAYTGRQHMMAQVLGFLPRTENPDWVLDSRLCPGPGLAVGVLGSDAAVGKFASHSYSCLVTLPFK